MTFWYLPLEVLEERYTKQMYQWVIRDLENRRVNYSVIQGTPLTNVTGGGQFLNWSSRVHFASTQIAEVSKLFYSGEVHSSDVFFVADFWHPGIEALRYMSDLLNLDIKIFGINYAGVFDPTDLVHPLIYWGAYQEAAWYSLFDKVFVGSDFHRDTILNGLERHDLRVPDIQNKLITTGLVWDSEDVIKLANEGHSPDPNRPIIIWPHRISPDKYLAGFYGLVDHLYHDYPSARWIISSSRSGQYFLPEHPAVEFISQSKADYYAMLKSACVMVSTAYHENFGYTVHEATILGTPVLCPRRADYPEMILSPDNLYNTQQELIAGVEKALAGNLPVARLKHTPGFTKMLDIMMGGE